MNNKLNQLPEVFLERLKKIVKDENFNDVVETFSNTKTASFRVNTLKTSVDECMESLNMLKVNYERVSWYKDAFLLNDISDEEKVKESFLYKNGHVYFQNLSSMIPALALDAKPNEKILDIAAAPGSKTTQIAAFMQNTGEILANDISRPRLYKMQAILKQYGVTNTKPFLCPGQYIWKRFPEYFDRVLVDAPCTMEGRFRLSDPDSYRDWSVKRVKDLAKRQQYLLRAAVSSTKVGGIIVYATCTISPEENEGVISWILEKEKGTLEVEKVTIDGIQTEPPIQELGKEKFDEQVTKTLRVLPSKTMEGFFVAKIRKIKSNFPAFWDEK